MDLLTLISTLDQTTFTRETISTKNNHDITSYRNTTGANITINNTTYTKPYRLCLKIKNNVTYLYVNHTTRTNLTKIAISTITTIS